MAKFIELTLTNLHKVTVNKEKVTFCNSHEDGKKEYTALGVEGTSQPIYVTEDYAHIRKLIGA